MNSSVNTTFFQVEINHVGEIEEIFDAISYKKGASVIRMLHSYLGAGRFQVNLLLFCDKGFRLLHMDHGSTSHSNSVLYLACKQKSLAAYIKKHACSNAKTEDLWAALEEGSSEPVNRLMNSWTKQKGYPVVSVKIKDQKLEFKQVYWQYV